MAVDETDDLRCQKTEAPYEIDLNPHDPSSVRHGTPKSGYDEGDLQGRHHSWST